MREAGLLFLIAIALLGPVLVSLAELLVRFPLLLVSGVGGRLALADIRRRPRRMAAAVSAVALGVAFVGANYLIDVTQTHGAVVQGGERLVADAAVSVRQGDTGPHLGFDLFFPRTYTTGGVQNLASAFAGDDDHAAFVGHRHIGWLDSHLAEADGSRGRLLPQSAACGDRDLGPGEHREAQLPRLTGVPAGTVDDGPPDGAHRRAGPTVSSSSDSSYGSGPASTVARVRPPWAMIIRSKVPAGGRGANQTAERLTYVTAAAGAPSVRRTAISPVSGPIAEPGQPGLSSGPSARPVSTDSEALRPVSLSPTSSQARAIPASTDAIRA